MTVALSGFRSQHGCGAAGDFHPSSLASSSFEIKEKVKVLSSYVKITKCFTN